MKIGPGSLGIPENESWSANIKTGLGALGTSQNESRREKHKN
jgi:hypothetical protein